MKRYYFIYFFLLINADLFAQIDVNSDIMQIDRLRMNQAIGKDTNLLHRSFAFRSTHQLYQHPKSSFSLLNWKKIKFDLENIGVQWMQNDTMGIGSNDGTFLPNVGIQKRYHASVKLTWKRIHLRFAPEMIEAENKPAVGFTYSPQDPNYIARYYLYTVNKIDMFSRFGNEKIKNKYLGQSSLRYQNDHISLGISNENIWWGPGLRNSLVMSNNATPFLHLTLNTVKPVKTKIGYFEGQVIWGNLKNPEFEHPDHERMKTIWLAGIRIKDSSTRALNGFNLSWEPKWTPNLFIGVSTASSFYQNDTLRRLVSFPLSTSYKPIKLGSFYMRYLMPKENAELYIEMGRADKFATPLNLIRDSIPMGYTAGVRKWTRLFKSNTYFYFGIEVTRLQLPDPRLIFTQGAPYGLPQTNSWYMGDHIAQGYTNNGQIMGAWIGPGSNSQTLQLGLVNGSKKIMLTGERVLHNEDFYYYNYITNDLRSNYQNPNKHWADISATAQIQWNVRNLLLSAAWSYTSLLNYRWTKLDGGFSGPSLLSDRKNTQVYASAVWYFNKNLLK